VAQLGAEQHMSIPKNVQKSSWSTRHHTETQKETLSTWRMNFKLLQ
jgi:hypothetical protein